MSDGDYGEAELSEFIRLLRVGLEAAGRYIERQTTATTALDLGRLVPRRAAADCD
jgi:hypothetical protein